MSFCSVPARRSGATPCRSAATRYIARMIGAVALIVKLTETSSSGSPANRSAMSSAVSIATPTRPTSARAVGWPESYPSCVGRSKATESAVWPRSSRKRNRSFASSGDPNPANCRIVHSCPRYIDG